MIYLVILLLLISGISKAITDISSADINTFYRSRLGKKLSPLWWHKASSSPNKYKGGIKANGEKFLWSTTLFVVFTDAWHLFTFISEVTMLLAVYLYPEIYIVLLYSIRLITFELLYRYIKGETLLR